MPYWQLYYHIVWATKNRELLLSPAIEPTIHDFLRSKAVKLGATVFALNGMPDHVHLIAAVPPQFAVARFIGQIKGASSARINKSSLLQQPFAWQEEYSVFSFDKKRLSNHVAYVERQKEHHTQGTTILSLERGDTSPLR